MTYITHFHKLVILKVLTEHQKAYRKYLLTDHWKALRERALERDGRACQWDIGNGEVCGETNGPLNVHHVKYRKTFEETRLEDLKTLCRTCHRIEHGLYVKFPFDWLRGDMEKGLMKEPMSIPSDLQIKQLIYEVNDWMDRVQAIGMLRLIERAKRFSGTCGRDDFMDICMWSLAEYDRLIAEVETNPPERYEHVW